MRIRCGALLLLCSFLCGCGRASVVPSPDGTMVAIPDGSRELCVVVQRKDGRVLWRWETGASPYQSWDLRWKDRKTLLLSSSDIGAITLELLPDGSWRESTPSSVFSPDGKEIVCTFWHSGESRRLKISFREVTGPRSQTVRAEFLTDFVVSDPFECARWDGPDRVVVTCMNGEHSWMRLPDGTWVLEK